MSVTVVCGMPFELTVAKKFFTNCQIIQYNHSPTFDLDEVVSPSCNAIASFGYNGGLAPGFKVGDMTLVESLRTETTVPPTQVPYIPNKIWNDKIKRCFQFPTTNINWKQATWFSNGQEDLANTVAQRKALAPVADVIDDESYYVLQVALKRKIPWTIVRVLSDDYSMNLPPAATGNVMNADGSANTAYVMEQIEKDPWQIPALVELALDLGYAQGILESCGKALGENFGFY